jgi:hypothetical protein
MSIRKTTAPNTRRDLSGGHGVSAPLIRSASELQQALPAVLCADGPVLLDIEVA